MTAPPGTPGAATMQMASTKMKLRKRGRLHGIPLMRQMVSAQQVIFIIDPERWMVAQSGMVNPAMPSVTPFFKVCFRVTGMVAADDDERYHKAQKLAEDAVEGEKRSDGSFIEEIAEDYTNRMAMMILAKSGILILFIFVKLLFACKGTIFLTFFQVFCCFFRICHAYCTTFMMFEGGHCAMSSCFM